MKKIIYVMCAALVALVSCQRDEIVYPVSNYYLAFDFSESSVRGMAASDINKIYSVTFFEKATGKFVYSTYMNPFNHPSGMPEGGYIKSVEPGGYNVIVYGYDSKVTKVNNVQSYKGMYADTDRYGYNNRVPVIMMPQDMLYDCIEVDMPFVAEGDDAFVMTVKPKTVCCYKRIVVEGIQNLENAENVTLYIAGQRPGDMLGGGITPVEGNAVIMFEGRIVDRRKPVISTKAGEDCGDTANDGGEGKGDEGEGQEPGQLDMYVVGDLLTFGYSDGGERCMLTVFVTGEGGVTSWAQVDVTDLMHESDAGGSDEIVVGVELEVNVRSDGGFEPVAEEWSSDVTEIELG